MRAIVQERYGSPDVLELRDVDQPVILDDQMLVRVRTASVHADVARDARCPLRPEDHGRDLRRALSSRGTYVLIGHDQYGAAGHRWFGSLGHFAKLMVMALFVYQLYPFPAVKDPGDRLMVLKDLIEAGV